MIPLATAGKMTSHNSAMIRSLYEPLIAYDGSEGDAVDRVPAADLADTVEFSEDDTEVTITLDERTWSDGEPVTSGDVAFWLDLVKANKDAWGNYRAGAMPDLIDTVETPDDKTVVLTFDGSYNEEWLLVLPAHPDRSDPGARLEHHRGRRHPRSGAREDRRGRDADLGVPDRGG